MDLLLDYTSEDELDQLAKNKEYQLEAMEHFKNVLIPLASDDMAQLTLDTLMLQEEADTEISIEILSKLHLKDALINFEI